ncbi:VOC family protein [Antribacter gilvus]|uniref:VOC family protein n=1 Tax=Antribacter gilvus TaxID=2304675 RepID=UPI000F7A7490|nr:VOC family protein [Antribacter gilvus]
MATLKDVVFDCRYPASLARFWAGVLDDYDVADYDDEELERLRAMGVDDPEDDPSVLVEAADGGSPRLFFNRVPEPKTVKNRVHLDLRTTDLEAEVARLIAAGASEVGRHENWVVLADPEGNEFCVFPD